MNLLPMSPVRLLPISPVHTKGGRGGFHSSKILFYGGKAEIRQKLNKLRFAPPDTTVQGKFLRGGKTDRALSSAELPGMKKEDIEVNLAGESLTIKGEKKEDKEVKEDNYYRRERSYGSFLRTVALPCEVKSAEIKASFKDGVLEIRMPKTEEAKKNSIAVQID